MIKPALMFLGLLALGGAAAQPSADKAAAWKPMRTPDGQPDLQGMWVNFDGTPFEADTSLAQSDVNPPSHWTDHDSPMSPKRRSMVVDPPDGRVPVMKWAEDKRDFDLAHLEDAPWYETPWVRCITRGVPAGMFPAGYNNAYQIIQIPGYVVIASEMIHDTRIIPLDGRPHLGSNIRQWNGDSRGRFEGNTLGRRDDELQRQGVDRDQRGDRSHTRHPAKRTIAPRRALHSRRREHDQLLGHDYRP